MRELRKLCERMEGAAAFEAKRAALKD